MLGVDVGRMWARRAALLLTCLAVFAYGTSSTNSFAPEPPHYKAFVTGGIDPCQGIPIPGGPRYAAGTVTVLKGRLSWASTRSEPALVPVFPTSMAAQATVAIDATYSFALEPGDYVLEAHYSPPSDVVPFTEITVHANDDLAVDIPNMCI